MAGTRLVIHVCFLASLVGLVAISAIIGLCLNPSDHLCRPLLLQQGRWWLYGKEAERLLNSATHCSLQQDERPTSPSCSTQRPSVSVAVPADQLSIWQASDFISGGSGLTTQPASSHHLSSVCSSVADESRFVSPYMPMADLWICGNADSAQQDLERPQESPAPSSPSLDVRPTIAVVNRSMIVTFPRPIGHRDRAVFMESILPARLGKGIDGPFDLRRPSQRRLAVTLWIGRGQDTTAWKTWFEYLRQSLRNDQQMRSLPCLAPLSTSNLARLSVSNADWTSLGQFGKDSLLNETEPPSDQAMAVHRLRDLVRLRQSRHGTTTEHDYSLHVVLPGSSTRVRLVPSDGDSFRAGESFAQLASNEWIAALDSTAPDPQSAVDHVVRRWFEQVVRTCLYIPPSFFHAKTSWADGTIPTFYTKLWVQSVRAGYESSIIIAAEQERSFIKTLPWSVVVSMDKVSAWKSSLQLLSASAYTLASDAHAAVARLDAARRLLMSVRYDPDLIVPPDDFPLDQYAAILAPLVMPLLLPLVFGLWREVKRYRELRDKKAPSPATDQSIRVPNKS